MAGTLHRQSLFPQIRLGNEGEVAPQPLPALLSRSRAWDNLFIIRVVITIVVMIIVILVTIVTIEIMMIIVIIVIIYDFA